MTYPEPTIRVNVDVTNPGQFFACCGLLELADRLWPGAEGWFEHGVHQFQIAGGGNLQSLIQAIATADLLQVRSDDPYSSPLVLSHPFRQLRIDWWETDQTGARDLKVWAGTMESFGIARSLQLTLRDDVFHSEDFFNVGVVVPSHLDRSKKKEPFYFDARRSPNAHSRDVGFSVNDLSISSIAHPAVEFLCLIGLQVTRPAPTIRKRIYDYFTWPVPLPSNLLMAASSGSLNFINSRRYQFENWFRTGQKKHKAFRNATRIQ